MTTAAVGSSTLPGYVYGRGEAGGVGAGFVTDAGRTGAANARRPAGAPASTSSRGAPPMIHGAPFVQAAPGRSMV